MNVTLEKSTEKNFDRGERVIMVDGVRWGRTFVSHHGVHGTKHTFQQEGTSGELEEHPGKRYPMPFNVRSMRRRRFTNSEWRPTEALVLEKVCALIADGKLRHPDIVRAENKAANDRWLADRELERTRSKAAFVDRAAECLKDISTTPRAELLARVVAAMEWAKEQ